MHNQNVLKQPVIERSKKAQSYELLKSGSALGAGGETASGAHIPMCDAHANEAAAEFDLKHAGKSKKKQQSCTGKTHFMAIMVHVSNLCLF